MLSLQGSSVCMQNQQGHRDCLLRSFCISWNCTIMSRPRQLLLLGMHCILILPWHRPTDGTDKV